MHVIYKENIPQFIYFNTLYNIFDDYLDEMTEDNIVYDSNVEEEFARKFESNEDFKMYIKLPDWFKIDTPLGRYNPDWAVLIEKDGAQRLYFVVETKGNILGEELRERESRKIQCGHKYFEALDTGVEFKETDSFENFVENI